MSESILAGEHRLLRIHFGEEDKFERTRLSQLILKLARKQNLAGCTIVRGMAGFGKGHRLHTQFQMEGAGWDLPLVIEVVDQKEKIERFLKEIEPMLSGTLVTEERAMVHHYSARMASDPSDRKGD
ncbi:DUF190 domain-containing protein [Candidatus Peregrinibacteria bacterium]|nr:DUF190 domain-containing protein [Candidatus Peregrinibacteria bacterium]